MDKLSKAEKKSPKLKKTKEIAKNIAAGQVAVGAGQKALRVPEVTRKLTSRYATGGQKVLGKALTKKLNPVRALSNITDVADLATREGRKSLMGKYSPMAKKDDSPDDMLADVISLALPLNPIDQVAAGSRMMDRARKGAKVYGKEVGDTAKATNKDKPKRVEKLTELADRLPKFRGL